MINHLAELGGLSFICINRHFMMGEIVYIALGVIVLYMVAKVISSIAIFPGQLFAKPQSLLNFQNDDEDLFLSFSTETTVKNRVLQTVTIEPVNKTGNVVIIFNGQNATFRNEKKIKTYCQLARDTGHTIIGFDYGGTGFKRLTTWSYHALVDDGFYLVRKIAKTMTDDHALILKGNSLGGALATKVARRCHDSDIKAYLWNGRSFKSTSAVIAGQIQTLHLSGHYDNKITKTLSTISQPVLFLFLWLMQFEINVAKDYKQIPADFKNYYIVRSRKADRLNKKDDVTIPHSATLESDPLIKETIKNTINEENKNDPGHIAYFHNRRKMISIFAKNAHATPESKLFCRKDMGLSAYNLFCLFATRYVENHRKKSDSQHIFIYS